MLFPSCLYTDSLCVYGAPKSFELNCSTVTVNEQEWK